MANLTPLAKHKVQFVADNLSENYIGDFRTFNDSKALNIQGDFLLKLAERVAVENVEKMTLSFILGAKKAEEHSRKLIELIDYVDKRPHRVIILTIKRDGRKAMCSPCIASDLTGTGCSHGLRVTLLLGDIPPAVPQSIPQPTQTTQPAVNHAIPVSTVFTAGSSLTTKSHNNYSSDSSNHSNSGPNYNPNLLYLNQQPSQQSLVSQYAYSNNNNKYNGLIPSNYVGSSNTYSNNIFSNNHISNGFGVDAASILRSNINHNTLINTSTNTNITADTHNTHDNSADDSMNIHDNELPLQRKRSRNAVNFGPAQDIVSFSVGDPPLAVRLSAQDQAAAQYNKLHRRTATRHCSFIYHLRELDNCVKHMVVCLAAQHVRQHSNITITANTNDSRINSNTATNNQAVDNYNYNSNNGGLSVLELAMGKGGDFQKWLEVGLTRYVGADIAENSLRDFVDNRLLDLVTPENSRRAIPLQDREKVQLLVVADLAAHSLLLPPSLSTVISTSSVSTNVSVTDTPTQPLQCFTWQQGWHTRLSGQVLSVGHTTTTSSDTNSRKEAEKKEVQVKVDSVFDVVSCQFALHYMCRSRFSFSFFLAQLKQHLSVTRGVFIATTVDCRVLAQYLRIVLFGSQKQLDQFSLKVDQLPSAPAIVAMNQLLTRKNYKNKSPTHNNSDNHNYHDGLDEKIRFSVVHKDLTKEVVLLTLSFSVQHALHLLNLNNNNYSNMRSENNDNDAEEEKEAEGQFGLEYSFTLFDNSLENNPNADTTKNTNTKSTNSGNIETNNHNANNNTNNFSLSASPEAVVGEVAVDAPEWVLPLTPHFLKLLQTHDLAVQRATNFQRFFSEECVGDAVPVEVRARLKKVRNAFLNEGMSNAEWSLARLYLVLVVTPLKSTDIDSTTNNISNSSSNRNKRDRGYWEREAQRLFFSDTEWLQHPHSAYIHNTSNSNSSSNTRNINKGKKQKLVSHPSSPVASAVSQLNPYTSFTSISNNYNTTNSTDSTSMNHSGVATHQQWLLRHREILCRSPDHPPPTSSATSTSALPPPPSDAVAVDEGVTDGQRWLAATPLTAQHWQQLLFAAQSRMDVDDNHDINDSKDDDNNITAMDEEDEELRLMEAICEQTWLLAGGQTAFEQMSESDQQRLQDEAELIVRQKQRS